MKVPLKYNLCLCGVQAWSACVLPGLGTPPQSKELPRRTVLRQIICTPPRGSNDAAWARLHRWRWLPRWGYNAGELSGLWSQADACKALFHQLVPNGAWVIMGGNLLCTYCPRLATITFNLYSIKRDRSNQWISEKVHKTGGWIEEK